MKMKVWKSVLSATVMSIALTTNMAFANMLIDDLSSLNIQNFNGQEWKVHHQENNTMRIDCTSCEKPTFINIQIGGRETFGSLGNKAAEKAKTNCIESNSTSLQCDTVKGIEIGGVSGIISTLKIIDGIYIASHVLGDNKTLLQIRTKAGGKDEAGTINQQLFEAIKSEVISQ